MLMLIVCGCGEMADTLDLGSSAERRAGSTPVIRTKSFEIKSQTQYAG